MAKKIGIWIPSRKNYQRIPGEESAFFLSEIKDRFMTELKSANLEIIENLNLKDSIVRNGKVFMNGICVSDLDLYFWFANLESSRTLDNKHTKYWIDCLYALGRHIPVINPPGLLEIVIDKFKSQTVLSENKILVPDFIVSQDKDEMEKTLKSFGEAIIKPRFGGAGCGMFKVNTSSQISSILNYSNRGVHFMERFIPYDVNNYTGINLINGKFLHSYTKKPEMIENNWKITGKKPGMMIHKEATKEEISIAKKVAKAIPMDFMAVDLIKGDDGKIYVIDINAFPGIYPDLIPKMKFDPFKELIKVIKNKI